MEMDEMHRKILDDHRRYLIRNLEPMKLLPYLNTVLDESDRQEIEQEPTVEKKVVKLLDMLPKRGPDAFDAFIKALEEKQKFIARCLKQETDGSCSRCVELEEELYFVTSDRDSITEENLILDKEVLKMSKRIEEISQDHEQEKQTLQEDLQILKKSLADQSERVAEESTKHVQAIKDLQLKNEKLRDTINQKITEISEITKLLATGQAALKNISEQLGQTNQNLASEKEKVKEDTGNLAAVSEEEKEIMEQIDSLQNERHNHDKHTGNGELEGQRIMQRRSVDLLHPRRSDTD
ncbi:keratin, type II cytoskeletal I-like [Montipora capricornis]|uniref:keratin, type II cytoskeletal I-like n=1 Tax=Montipora capricornis TaxID=246305 RepID=UPI0035F1693A